MARGGDQAESIREGSGESGQKSDLFTLAAPGTRNPWAPANGNGDDSQRGRRLIMGRIDGRMYRGDR